MSYLPNFCLLPYGDFQHILCCVFVYDLFSNQSPGIF